MSGHWIQEGKRIVLDQEFHKVGEVEYEVKNE